MEVAAVVERVLAYGARFVVLTGGEPMVARGIHDLAAALKAVGMHITIETAGTVAPNGIACDLASVSPKLANSTPQSGTIDDAWINRHEATRLQPDVVREWMRASDYQLKFVVSQQSNLTEIQELLQTLGDDIPAHCVQIMPEGIDAGTLLTRQREWVEVCKTYGYRLIHRLHVELFGNTRGT